MRDIKQMYDTCNDYHGGFQVLLLTTLAERHSRTAQEALKERLKIPAFATPEIATVLFLQVRMK